MTFRTLNMLMTVAALGIASPALARPGAQLPCNALCRAYMGSHYIPSGEPVAAEPVETSAARAPDEEFAVPPRRPVQAGAPSARRFAVLPPRRPGLVFPEALRDPAPVTSEAASPVILPVPSPVPLPATLPFAAGPSPISAERPHTVATAPVPDTATMVEPSAADPVVVPAQEFEGVAAPAQGEPGLAASADAVLVREEPYRMAVPSAAASVLASVPRPEPRQRSLLE